MGGDRMQAARDDYAMRTRYLTRFSKHAVVAIFARHNGRNLMNTDHQRGYYPAILMVAYFDRTLPGIEWAI